MKILMTCVCVFAGFGASAFFTMWALTSLSRMSGFAPIHVSRVTGAMLGAVIFGVIVSWVAFELMERHFQSR